MITLQQAKAELRKNADTGVRCPCCDRFYKIYKRKLHSEMARFLIRLSKAGDGWHSPRSLGLGGPKASTDGSYLVHWKLIEKSEHGYKITRKGKRFVKNKLRIPRRVHLLNNAVVGWSPETTNAKEALGDKFDYQELMSL